jgi:hypothetical protein
MLRHDELLRLGLSNPTERLPMQWLDTLPDLLSDLSALLNIWPLQSLWLL